MEAWIALGAVVLPGTHVAAGAVVSLRSTISGMTEPWTIYRGTPAAPVGQRKVDKPLRVEECSGKKKVSQVM